MRVWAYSCLGGHSMVCPNRQTKHSYFSPKLLARGGGGVGGGHQKFFRTYQKNFPDISQNFPYHHVIFAKVQGIFQDVSKFSRNFWVLAEFCIAFCPTVKIFGGTCPPPCPPRPIRLWCQAIAWGIRRIYELNYVKYNCQHEAN
jgi:hypothetical protein